MASMSTQETSSSPSISSTPHWSYDVFLSFYGSDTRKTFADQLYTAMKDRGISVYRDSEELKQGTFIGPKLMEVIEKSRYAITILSRNYAFSSWCLDELVEIVKCMKETQLTILPIFYHVKPSHIRNQTRTFKKAFSKHEKDAEVNKEKIQTWKAALRKVGDIAGWHIHDRYESEVVQEIIDIILHELNREFPNACEHLVGMDSHVEKMMNLCGTELDGVRFIGIWGMGGIGKTTLAYFIYKRICHQFEASSFIYNVRETVEKHGIVYLQKQLLSEAFMEKEANIWNHHVGIGLIKKRLPTKKVLLIVDDVDKYEQLQALAGNHDWFSQGSRIIVTTKDKHLLEMCRVDYIYRVEGLANDKSLELFSLTVFNKTTPRKEFLDLSKGFVKYAKGLPLALKVLGSSLIGKTRSVWKNYLDQLKENHDGEILDTLEIGYKGLKDTVKNLFLDIACFFKGEDKDRVVDIKGSSCYMDLETLNDKSLITILGRKLWMHDLLQEMGWRIVCRESFQEPGRRSRLWLCEDIFHVLKNNTGTKIVEGMVLNSPLHIEDLNAKAFSNMKRLRMIKICNVHLPQGLSFLSNELRVMEWHDYPLKFMPRHFQPNNLVELIMLRSHIKQLPKEFSNLDKLKLMDLSNSQNLIMTPNFNGLQSLERLILRGCIRLHKLHPSVGSLKRLLELNLDGTAIEELPLTIEDLTSLTLLSLQNCKKLLSFPSVCLPSLKILILKGCNKVQPPKSWLLQGLSRICAPHDLLKYCFFPTQDPNNLLLPRSSGLSFMVSLDLSDCNLLDGALPGDLSCLSLLRSLNLSNNKFTHLPSSISQLSSLKIFELKDCSRLQSLPDLPLSTLYVMAQGCPLENYLNQVMWTSGETGFTTVDFYGNEGEITYSGLFTPVDQLELLWERHVKAAINQDVELGIYSLVTEIPKWFIRQGPPSSVTIPSSDLCTNSYWRGIALSVVCVVSENFNDLFSGLDLKFLAEFNFRSNMNRVRVECYPLVLKRNGFLDASSFTFHVYIPAARLGDHLDDCDCIGASIAIEHPFIEPTKCGVRIVFSQDVEGFAQAIFPDGVQSYPRPGSSISKCQVDMVESSMSKGQNDSNIMQEKKFKCLLSTLYQVSCDLPKTPYFGISFYLTH